MGFFTAMLVSFAFMLVGELIRPKQNPENAKASGLDEFDAPTAEEGRSIPVFAGKVKISGPSVTWYGHLAAVPIKKKVKTGLFSSKKQTIGYKYYMGQELCMAHGRDDIQVHQVLFDDEEPTYTRSEDAATGILTITFNDEDFYGGKESGGGVTGTMRVYRGKAGQGANAYLTAQLGEDAPPYEGLFRAVLEHVYLGTSNYIKPISWVVSSYPNQLGLADGKHKIGEDANPMCIVYECLTNAVWGCGISAAELDVAAMRAVADTLVDDGFGMSVIYNGGSNARDIISDILRHIDGVMFTDPDTGLYTVGLARGGYDAITLPVYDESVFSGGIQFTRPSWSETKNHIKGSYIDPAKGYEPAFISQSDLANVTQRGGEMAYQTVEFNGFTTYDATAKAVARTLKTLSYPLGKLSGAINMTLPERPRPNGLFWCRWSTGDLKVNAVFRLSSVDYGTVETNTYQIEAVEDIFAITGVSSVAPDPSAWVTPIGRSGTLVAPALLEAPYYLTQDANPTLLSMGYRRDGMDLGYYIHAGSSAGAMTQGPAVSEFTALATLAAAYPATPAAIDAGFTVAELYGEADLLADVTISTAGRDQGDTLAVILSADTEEVVAFASYDAATKTFGGVARGLLDTVPQDHPAGAVVYFLGTGYGLGSDNAVSGTVYGRLVPFNGKGAGRVEDAALLTLPITQRAQRPYPPGNVKVNGQHPLTLTTPLSGAAITVTWAGRDRTSQTLYRQDSASDSVADATYTLQVFSEAGALLAENTGIQGITHSATVSLAYTGAATFRLTTAGAYQAHEFTLTIGAAGVASSVTANDDVFILDGGAP